MAAQHISVCICTYKRSHLLARLLRELARQHTDGIFTYSIVVVDNDCSQSAEAVVGSLAANLPVPVRYCVETRQNIAMARNKAIENAEGDFVALIDDDEFPTPFWLLTLFKALNHYKVDGVLGPVKPHFEVEPPRWVVKGKFYERLTYPTGFVIDWKKGRTGNVLLKRSIFTPGERPFRPEFLTGEDQDFFRRMIEKHCVFIWCDEAGAVAYEAVPPIRWKRTFMLRRALFWGANSLRHPGSGTLGIAKSAIAVVVYTVALPVALLLGQRELMLCLVRLASHMGKLLALAGINPIREPYVTE